MHRTKAELIRIEAATLPRIYKVEMEHASLFFYLAKPQSGGIWGCDLCHCTSEPFDFRRFVYQIHAATLPRIYKVEMEHASLFFYLAKPRACAHYVMVSKIQWKPFWLATQRDPQNDWTATQNRVNYDVFAQAPSGGILGCDLRHCTSEPFIEPRMDVR